MKQIKNFRLELLSFLERDYSLLKSKAHSVDLVEESTSNDERGIVKRSVYEWELDEKILIFTDVEQIEFNDKPHVFTLKSCNSSNSEFKELINRLVNVIGIDLNGKGKINVINQSNSRLHYLRIWSFDKSHNILKSGYPPKGEGYILSTNSYNNISKLQIIRFHNLFVPC